MSCNRFFNAKQYFLLYKDKWVMLLGTKCNFTVDEKEDE